MEESLREMLSLADLTDLGFELPERDWSQYAPLTLAWMGDTVFDLVVRTILVKQADRQTMKLHRKASEIVSARAQAALAERILPDLSAEEQAVFRRGRNSSPGHNAKNAERAEYLEATGLEALIGWLYLERRYERIVELLSRSSVLSELSGKRGKGSGSSAVKA